MVLYLHFWERNHLWMNFLLQKYFLVSYLNSAWILVSGPNSFPYHLFEKLLLVSTPIRFASDHHPPPSCSSLLFGNYRVCSACKTTFYVLGKNEAESNSSSSCIRYYLDTLFQYWKQFELFLKKNFNTVPICQWLSHQFIKKFRISVKLEQCVYSYTKRRDLKDFWLYKGVKTFCLLHGPSFICILSQVIYVPKLQ